MQIVQASILTELLLPLALAFVMFGMGLTLTAADFLRLIKAPKPIIVGLIGQTLLLPLLALCLCIVFSLPPLMAIGVMILSACPGGTMSNLISHLGRANLALSVSLTALSTFVCVFSTPFIIHYSMRYFVGEQAPEFSIINTVMGLVGISIVPVLIGMAIRHFNGRYANKVEGFFRHFSLLFMVAMIIGILVSERDNLRAALEEALLVCVALNICAVSLGLLMGKVCRLSHIDGVTLGIEVGVQNAALAMLICISFLDAPALAIPAGVYGLAMYLAPSVLVMWSKRAQRVVKARRVKYAE